MFGNLSQNYQIIVNKVRMDKNGNPLIQNGQYWYGFENINIMLNEINELKKQNEILFNDNKNLMNRVNKEMMDNQNLNNEIYKLK
jgi:hypothetical protein